MQQVMLPELGEGIEKAVVAFWHFKEGDRVQKGEDVVELVTDKATFNVSAQEAGILKEILVEEGKEVLIGSVLAIIDN